MNLTRLTIPFVVALSMVAGCAADTSEDNVTEDENAITRAITMTCSFEDVPAFWGDTFDDPYQLLIEGNRVTGKLGPNDSDPDYFSFERKEGTGKLFLGEELPVPESASRGQWSVLAGLEVSPDVSRGRSGSIKLTYWVKKGERVARYKGSPEQRLVRSLASRETSPVVRVNLEGVDQFASADLSAGCRYSGSPR